MTTKADFVICFISILRQTRVISHLLKQQTQQALNIKRQKQGVIKQSYPCAL